jgi:flagellar motor switch/type III secretory pathway protein FliN
MGGDTVFLRVPTAWMQACWQRSAAIASDAIGPMEEGAAQYVFDRVARALAAELAEEVELSGWLQPADAEREARDTLPWLTSELLVRSGDSSFLSTAFIPVRRQEAAPYEPPPSLAFPARVVLGSVRLALSDFAALEPGDALIPDAFFPRGFLEDGKAERGPCWLKVRSFWFGATLLASEAGANLRLDQTWLRSPGEDWLMADDDAIDRGAASIPVADIELSVQIELDRFPVTLGELQKWRAGEIVSLRAGLQDPVKLVVETGLQRRVLGEGRVVVVNGKLGVEILRVVTRFEDQTPPRS